MRVCTNIYKDASDFPKAILIKMWQGKHRMYIYYVHREKANNQFLHDTTYTRNKQSLVNFWNTHKDKEDKNTKKIANNAFFKIRFGGIYGLQNYKSLKILC